MIIWKSSQTKWIQRIREESTSNLKENSQHRKTDKNQWIKIKYHKTTRLVKYIKDIKKYISYVYERRKKYIKSIYVKYIKCIKSRLVKNIKIIKKYIKDITRHNKHIS